MKQSLPFRTESASALSLLAMTATNLLTLFQRNAHVPAGAIDYEKPVARMEPFDFAQDKLRGIRDSYSASRSFLDYASLHPGYILAASHNDSLFSSISLDKHLVA